MTLRWPLFLALLCGAALTCTAATTSPAREAEQQMAQLTKKPGRYAATEARSHWYNFFIRPAKENPGDQLAYAEKLRQDGRLRAAGKQFRLLTVFWPQAPEASKAQLAYARVLDLRKQRNEWWTSWDDAFNEYVYLIEHYPGTFNYNEILQRMFELAETVMATRKGKFLIIPGFKTPERAVPLFEKILEHGPEWEQAPACQFYIGRAYEYNYDYELAIAAYLTAIVRYPHSPYAEQAAYHRALCLENLATSSPNNEATLDEAWTAMHQFAARYPKSEHLIEVTKLRDDLQRRRARLAYDRAHYYDAIAKKPKAASLEYQEFVRAFPQSDWTAEAQKRIEQLAPLVAKEEHDQAKP